MKYHPILFNGEMVRAILEGRKSQTRRVIKFPLNKTHVVGNPVKLFGDWPLSRVGDLKDGVLGYDCQSEVDDTISGSVKCPYGKPGDRLWVRETWCQKWIPGKGFGDEWFYRATEKKEIVHVDDGEKSPWRPSIHMPRVASRITLKVTDVRVERVQDISEKDVRSEGVNFFGAPDGHLKWVKLWDSINEKRGFGWEKNPWVWVVEFKRLNDV